MATWIEIATQAWGQLVKPGTNQPLANSVPQINTTVRATGSDTGTVIQPADWKSDQDGLLPGWVAEGSWLFIEPDGQSRQVEATHGGRGPQLESLKANLPVNVADHGAVKTLADAASRAANVTAFNNAIAEANTNARLVEVPPGTYYFTAGVGLTRLTGARGMICEGLATLEFNVNGDCLVTKGSYKKLRGLSVANRVTAHTAADACIRIKNCAYGEFSMLYGTSGGTGPSRSIMLEHEYDGSADDAYFIVHLGCWYNRFDNVTAGYLSSSETVGYGISFEVNANAVGVVNPPGEPAGTYTGSVSYNTVAGINIEGKARGLNLDRASSNKFIGGQFLANADQVYGRNANYNSFDKINHNQWGTWPYNLDATCAKNRGRDLSFFLTSAQPWNISGGCALNAMYFDVAPEGIAEYGSAEKWSEVGAAGQPAFGANWGNLAGYATAAFYRDGNGRVYLRGSVTKTGTPASGDIIFTLPAGYRPTAREMFAVVTGAGVVIGRVDVHANGAVEWQLGATGETDYTSLSGISFRV